MLPACDHPSHRNPGLITPCPQCGEEASALDSKARPPSFLSWCDESRWSQDRIRYLEDRLAALESERDALRAMAIGAIRLLAESGADQRFAKFIRATLDSALRTGSDGDG